MNKKDSWISEYRKAKFYEKHQKSDYIDNSNFHNNKKDIINIMLDIEGTLDGLYDKLATYFLRQLNEIRKRFGAKKVQISISTHSSNYKSVKKVLEIFDRNLIKTVEIGKSYFFGGIYNFNDDLVENKEFGFNSNKVDTFISNSVGYTTSFFAIVDDSINESIYKKFKSIIPMIVCRPSQNCLSKDDNFMSLSTITKGFLGVIEMFDKYLQSIKDLNYYTVLDKQENMITHLDSYELNMKIKNREYQFLIRYLKEGYADFDDYSCILLWIGCTIYNVVPTKEELKQIKIILELLDKEYIKNENVDNLNTVKMYKKFLGME